jgi:hypothetical protein
MAEVTPPEQSDAPKVAATAEQLASVAASDLGKVVAGAPAAESKFKAFFVKHEKVLAILGVLAVVSAILHFV